MKKLLWLWLALTLGVLVYGFYLAIFVAPADAEQGNVFRIFFYHVPSAIMGLVFPYVNFIAALFYLGLRRRNPVGADKADALALAAAEVALVFTTICLATGMLWGRAAWGHMVGVGRSPDEPAAALAALCVLPGGAPLLLHRPDADAGSHHLGLRGGGCAYRLHVDTLVAHAASGAGLLRRQDSGVDPSMMPAFLWNFLGWSMWGVFLVCLRYGLERMRQARARSMALEAVEGNA